MNAFAHSLAAALAVVAALFLHPAHAAQPLMAQEIALPHVSVLFGGDMMFDRTVRSAIDEKGGDYIFSCIDKTLRSADVVVANLEGPITATSSRSLGSAIGSSDNFVFTFPTSTAPLLAAHRIRIVNIGNNHILNFGSDGVRSTIAALSGAGVSYFGDPLEHVVAAGQFDGVKLAFINYNQFVNGGEASTTLAQIRAAKAAGELPIVYTHWGVEYATSSPPYIHQLAHSFVDAGAVLVVGSHPHVVEEHEQYHGAYIYYSLGNLIFDQYWDDAVDHGLLLKVDLTQAGVQALQEIPVTLMHDRRTCPSSS